MKLTAYPDRSIDTEKVRNAIKSQNQSEFFTVTEGGYLRAVNGGGKLEPVKSLKACDVTHNNFWTDLQLFGLCKQFPAGSF